MRAGGRSRSPFPDVRDLDPGYVKLHEPRGVDGLRRGGI